ncbi:MAG: acyl-CoA dehydrogenase [Calditrichaeota bacterium]|nr:MAG: acyl-CoA dehydrogenase [Calditrichota bacterium]
MIYLTEEQIQVRDMARDFAQNEIAPVAAELDETSTFPVDNVAKMAELGLFGMPFDVNYGGSEMDTVSCSLVIEELAKVCASHSITVGAHLSLGTTPIAMFGNDAQKEKYMPSLCSGEYLGAFGLTEPNAGSDSGGTQTTAVRDGDNYIINGSKIFITNAAYAGTIIITAVTDKDKGKRGINAFVLERGMEGLHIGKKEEKMGWRASDTRALTFDNIVIPKENLLGDPGAGFVQFMKILDGGRIGIAALSLGIAEGAYEASLAYSKERAQFGKSISKFQAISFKLANMAMEIEAGRQLMLVAARLKDAGKNFTKEAAMAKLYCSELAMRVTTDAIQVHGGYGYIKEYPVERYFRDAKICEIGEGTSEIQRIVISREILK